MTLHIFNTFSPTDLEQCLVICTNSDAIVLIEEASQEALSKRWLPERPSCPIFALTQTAQPKQKDAEAKNTKKEITEITEINQQEFVDLTAKHNPLLSW